MKKETRKKKQKTETRNKVIRKKEQQITDNNKSCIESLGMNFIK